ncbi:MAG: hypothetical protein ABIN94_14845 [Ferruginibacter sp.]
MISRLLLVAVPSPAFSTPQTGVHIWKMPVGITFFQDIRARYRFVPVNK